MTTLEDEADPAPAGAPADAGPGLLLVWAAGRPRATALPLVNGAIELGRDELVAAGCLDDRVSRAHLRVEFAGGAWRVLDRGSTNGTFVDGEPLAGAPFFGSAAPRVIRIGRTLLLPRAELGPLVELGVRVEAGVARGPALQRLTARAAALARQGENLLVTGESGTGKEIMARAFHEAGPRAGGPFVAVNCAAIARDLAERLLFGARRGAFTGAVADAEGYLQAAHGGTLFLDEVAELEAPNQARLLRAIDTREVLPLGATRPSRVEFGLCAATLRDLRVEVQSGRFREDLYFRVGRPDLPLPPLRERDEEIPWIIELARATVPRAPAAAAGFVERCLLRPWPGNVRELRREVRAAVTSAHAAARDHLEAADLDPRAGLPLDGAATPAPPSEHARIVEALERCGGNQSRAARALGISRGTLLSRLDQFGITRPRKPR